MRDAQGARTLVCLVVASQPVVGSSYCVTGRSSGFHCGWVVKARNHTACYSEPAGVPCFKQLAAVTRSGSPSVVQRGDSGGPFCIKNATDGVGVRGIVSGRTLVDSVNPGGWTSLIQQYRSIADFYVSYAVTE